MSSRSLQPLWTCPRCSRGFANRNQSHSCGSFSLETHFENKAPVVRDIFDAFVALLREIGPCTVLPEKTRIAFQARMSFAQLTTRRNWVDGHVVLARRLDHPRFRSVQTLSPRNHVHSFRLLSAVDVDDVVRAWLEEAYAVGLQQHL